MILPRLSLVLLAVLLAASSLQPLHAQVALEVRAACEPSEPSCSSLERSVFRVDADGGVVAPGAIGYGTIPAAGEGVRMMWHPHKGAFRAGAASAAGEFDEGNVGFYSWAGGHGTIANDYASFAFGDQVAVTGSLGAGFGSSNVVDGDYGFTAGSENRCVGSGCLAIGFRARAYGQGAIALGYRATASGDNSMAVGRMASTNGYTGAFVWGDASVNDSVRATANNQFTVRARGGIRLRTSAVTDSNVGVNGNTGCDIPGNSGVLSCASSRTLKEGFVGVDGEAVLARIRATPVTTWNYIDEGEQVRHMGPMAEDFYDAFGLGANNTTIGHLDIDGATFAGVQALDARTLAQSGRLAVLEAENAALRTQNAAVLAELAALRAERDASEARLARLEAVVLGRPEPGALPVAFAGTQ